MSGSPRSPYNSRGTLSFPAQLHKSHEILPSTRDEALLHCSVSQQIPRSLLELERKFDILYESPEASQDTHTHSRGILSFPPQLKRSPVFPASIRDECQFLCFVGKGIPMCPSPLKRGPVSPRNPSATPGVVPHFEKTPISPSTTDKPHYPALTQLGPRVLTPNTKGRVKALWYLKKKPHIPTPT